MGRLGKSAQGLRRARQVIADFAAARDSLGRIGQHELVALLDGVTTLG
jgi:hypothetical protein